MIFIYGDPPNDHLSRNWAPQIEGNMYFYTVNPPGMIIRVGTGQPQSEGNMYFYTVTTPLGFKAKAKAKARARARKWIQCRFALYCILEYILDVQWSKKQNTTRQIIPIINTWTTVSRASDKVKRNHW